ncbi:RNA-binding protein 1 [Oryza sativa Japonica Group]|uniref:Os06g0127500 protein n=2 Tax=Oryza sativa subsp. japonica TaxID=39947 RepID=B9FRA2_ORYSJ|nr:RNA-binding protein 1 [Oryza sativa Japonica Group]XP_015641359.1 RNA-binding protein 1 [Oryza sativa Japonica Group]KAB8101009.1 hypothetical protein EE612_031677 [Oryza sativa]EEE65013.1 hypothetical protein OsJ_19964 [Oryza sativa Japonica Group]KAF2924958.1 hypothetical protein DAI22_06g017100 [Oryza sativa Japonica Group]KAF2924959.1 hypothetical protein DAI22_06g017100 [Oryza sativa Japonica Group]BAS95935.1 Os06g0127500 [Oryza sativa Japonica Group]
MADAYWRYAAAADAARHHHHHQLPLSAAPAAGMPAPPPAASQVAAAGQPLKRPRPADFSDVPGAPEMAGYYSRDEERPGYRPARDTEALNASYERFLRTGQIQSYGAGAGAGPGAESIRPAAGGNAGYPVEDRPMMAGGGMEARNIGFGGGMPEPPLPPDASNTLFIEGIPTDCARREVSHIFRPFVGFREVRLVSKEARHPGGDPILLCFVDFETASQAAIAMDALQGYKFDEHDRNSPHLRLQFARFTGPRGGSGPGGGRVRR